HELPAERVELALSHCQVGGARVEESEVIAGFEAVYAHLRRLARHHRNADAAVAVERVCARVVGPKDSITEHLADAISTAVVRRAVVVGRARLAIASQRGRRPACTMITDKAGVAVTARDAAHRVRSARVLPTIGLACHWSSARGALHRWGDDRCPGV